MVKGCHNPEVSREQRKSKGRGEQSKESLISIESAKKETLHRSIREGNHNKGGEE